MVSRKQIDDPLANDRLKEILWKKRKGSLLTLIGILKVSLEMSLSKTYTLDEFSENNKKFIVLMILF